MIEADTRIEMSRGCANHTVLKRAPRSAAHCTRRAQPRAVSNPTARGSRAVDFQFVRDGNNRVRPLFLRIHAKAVNFPATLACGAGRHHIQRVIRIAISQSADAIASTMPLGSVAYEGQTNEKGERLIWLPPDVIAKLKAMRGPGDSYSDVIVCVARGDGSRALPDNGLSAACNWEQVVPRCGTKCGAGSPLKLYLFDVTK